MPDAGRVIAGTAKGTRLRAPGLGTRPLTDRVKQTLFAILEPDLRGARFLDLFAGSGAAGIEALSRGAASATFVEDSQRAVATIEQNVGRAGFGPPAADVHRTSVAGFLRAGSPGLPFDVVVIDPPYDDRAALADALDGLAGSGILAPHARVVVKHFWRTPMPGRSGLLASERVERFGETALTFYRRVDDGEG